MTGIVLAGGGNTRMGQDKAFLTVGGRRLIDRTVGVLRSLFREVIIVAADPFAHLDQDCALVTDILPGTGALGGLYTGLFTASDDYAFVVACDIPFLNRPFIEYMTSLAAGYDIVVPAPPDGLQPLHAVYSRRCLPVIRSLLVKGRRQIKELYPSQRLLRIEPEVLNSFDPGGAMFLNINTPEDLRNLPPD